jgi:tRNA dimethylallyltransferase
VLRALERAEAGGGGVAPRADPWPGRVALVGLSRPRPVLDRRIEERATRMFRDGLLDEVRRLLDAGYGPELGPMTGHGYREAARHLAGEWSLDEAIAVTVRRTRRYARRQLSWFGRDPRIVWLPARDLSGDDPQIVDRALEVVNRLIG